MGVFTKVSYYALKLKLCQIQNCKESEERARSCAEATQPRKTIVHPEQ